MSRNSSAKEERGTASWRIAGSSGREVAAEDVEAAGRAAWEMVQDDDAVQVRVGGGR